MGEGDSTELSSGIRVNYFLPTINNGKNRKVETATAHISTGNADRLQEIFPRDVFDPETSEILGLKHYVTDKYRHGGYKTEANKEGLFLGAECFGNEEGWSILEDGVYRPYIALEIPYTLFSENQIPAKDKHLSIFSPSLNVNLELLDVKFDYGSNSFKLQEFLITDPQSEEKSIRLELLYLKDYYHQYPEVQKYHEMRYLLYGVNQNILTSMAGHWAMKGYEERVKQYNPETVFKSIFIPEDEYTENLRIIRSITGINAPFFALRQEALYIGI